MSTHHLEIPLNKSKIILMFLGSLAFVAIGLWFVISPPTIRNSFWGDPLKLAIIGYLSIVFFGIAAFMIGRKLPDNKPGLIIDESGLTDNASGAAAGHIAWQDIEEISVMEVRKQKIIMLHLTNPVEYINRHSGIKRKMLQMSYNMYGTPVSIPSNTLKISFEELIGTLMDQLARSKQTLDKI